MSAEGKRGTWSTSTLLITVASTVSWWDEERHEASSTSRSSITLHHHSPVILTSPFNPAIKLSFVPLQVKTGLCTHDVPCLFDCLDLCLVHFSPYVKQDLTIDWHSSEGCFLLLIWFDIYQVISFPLCWPSFFRGMWHVRLTFSTTKATRQETTKTATKWNNTRHLSINLKKHDKEESTRRIRYLQSTIRFLPPPPKESLIHTSFQDLSFFTVIQLNRYTYFDTLMPHRRR